MRHERQDNGDFSSRPAINLFGRQEARITKVDHLRIETSETYY